MQQYIGNKDGKGRDAQQNRYQNWLKQFYNLVFVSKLVLFVRLPRIKRNKDTNIF